MWNPFILTYEDMIAGISECSCTWDALPDRYFVHFLSVGVVAVGIVTAWRILFTKYSTSLSYSYVFRQTGINVKNVCKPQIFPCQESTANHENFVILNKFCRQKFGDCESSKNMTVLKRKNRKDKNNTNLNEEIKELSNQLNVETTDIESYIKYYKDSSMTKILIHKYCEELWKTITMFIVTVVGIYALYDKSFIYNPLHLYGCPQSLPFEIEFYYFASMGYHGHRLLWQHIDTVRIDWFANFIHHWVTVSLIACSYVYGFTNIGAFVMILHDNTDFFLSFAKIVKYAALGQALNNMIFLCFAFSWYYGRMFIFMFDIIIPCFQLYFVCAHVEWYHPLFYYGFFGGMICLWILHCYWGILVAKVMIKLVSKGKLNDSRSEDEKDVKISKNIKKTQ